jgi:nucleoside 2-deoxyribosyltransferase
MDLVSRLPEVQVYYDMLIPAGESLAHTLAAQIEQADIVLVALSPDYLSSPWCDQELNVALDRRLHGDARIIPLLIRPCNPTGFLSLLTWVDFTEDYQDALERLIWGITGERPRAAKGEEPGVPVRAIPPAEVRNYHRDVQEAVEHFKSPTPEPTPNVPPAPSTPRSEGAKRRCFVVMPFGDPDLEIVYEDFVRDTLSKKCDLDCERGDDVFGSNVIVDDIFKQIRSADVILADLTRKNANVFYEVGICHALGKPVLLLAQSVDDVPFDLRHRRVLLYEYSPRGCKRLEENLKKNMNAVLEEL